MERALDESQALVERDPTAITQLLDWADEQAGSEASPVARDRLLELASMAAQAAAENGTDAAQSLSLGVLGAFVARSAGADPHFSGALPVAFDALAALVAATPDEGHAAELVDYLRKSRFNSIIEAGIEPTSTFHRLALQFGCLLLNDAADRRRRRVAVASIALLEQFLVRRTDGLHRASVAVYLAAIGGLLERPWVATELTARLRTSLECLRQEAVGQGDQLLEGQIALAHAALGDGHSPG